MKERPIIFNGPMVNTVLDGSKRQTRRLVKGFALELLQPNNFTPEYVAHPENGLSPFGFAGDRLWVRETTYDVERSGYIGPVYVESEEGHNAAAWGYGESDDPDHIEPYELRKRPAIHMPRSMCRLVLDITGVRVERLNSISDEDAEAEGIAFLRRVPDVDETLAPRDLFMCLWDSVATVGADWKSNPWVWVVDFNRVDAKDHS